MKDFIKASEDLLLEAKYCLETDDTTRLCESILWTFKKININEDIDKKLKKLEAQVELKNAEIDYSHLHKAFWYLKNKDFSIEHMDDFAKIVDNKNDEIYDMKENIKKEGL